VTPEQLLNQNSYGIAAAAVLVWAAYRAIRGRPSVRSVLLFGCLAAALAAPPLWLRSAPRGLADLDRALASGQPTVVEVYSDL
jgi:hypothetical protein